MTIGYIIILLYSMLVELHSLIQKNISQWNREHLLTGPRSQIVFRCWAFGLFSVQFFKIGSWSTALIQSKAISSSITDASIWLVELAGVCWDGAWKMSWVLKGVSLWGPYLRWSFIMHFLNAMWQIKLIAYHRWHIGMPCKPCDCFVDNLNWKPKVLVRQNISSLVLDIHKLMKYRSQFKFPKR